MARTRTNIEKICTNRLVFFETLLDEFLPDTIMIVSKTFDTPLYENITFEFEFLSPRHRAEDISTLIEVVGYLGGTVIVGESNNAIGVFEKGIDYEKNSVI